MTQLRARLEAVEIPRSIPGFTMRRYEAGDEVKILAGFHRVFGANQPGFRPRPIERWRWQYLENPCGTQVVVAIHDESGELAGHYAGIPRAFEGFGREGLAAEAVDSFVDPKFRAALRRPGLFVVMALTWYREFCGAGGDFFAYGLPIESAARIGGAFLDYQVVHQQLALERPIAGGREFGGPAAPAAAVLTAFDDRVDALWHRVKSEFGAAASRTSAFLNWRFARHPEHAYAIGAVGNDRALDGYVVTRRGPFDDRDDELIVDFLVKPGDLDTMRALLRFAADRARAGGAGRLTAVLPPSAPWFVALQRLGFTARATKYDWSVSHNRRPYETHDLRRHWWYTLADTDLA
jgi:hypothetical protein